ncbi:MBL fold metallo-hydrolase [Phytoactinopolyspora limicola]|uniref:MBL fold metallo-hydrolase n=1 Tax=Phytoactinopolyspora limicola TaxID=2715536 RepID=UPI001A9C9BE2|nr:MBL fold metallo-hydrolase [Phytoactinopolyspora limicola]
MFTASRTVGQVEVTCLLDGSGPFTLATLEATFPNATAADWSAARRLDPKAFGADGRWHLSFHCFAIRVPGGRIVLVDTGIGPADGPASTWAPVPGRLPEALAEAGIAASDVSLVVQTHLHTDHVGWAVSLEGDPVFSNARYVVQRAELAALEKAGSPLLEAVVRPLRQRDQLDAVDGSLDLLGGHGRHGARIAVSATPGHTPGHQSVVVDSGADRMVITGDVLVHAVQLVNPDVRYTYEDDADLARRSRRDLLADAEAHRAFLATAHLNQPFMPTPLR